MSKIILTMGIFLLSAGVNLVADELDEITIVDESAKSALFQKDTLIIGCSDDPTKKESTCAKNPEEIILSKLPTSKQINDTNLDDKEKSQDIKTQLEDILTQLQELKLEQKADRETIKELKSVISVLSDNKLKKSNKTSAVKKGIAKLKPKHSATGRHRKAIKELAVYDDYVVIQVQKNESLSIYAKHYYNNSRKYYKIYRANRDKIKPNLQLVVGQELIIPDVHITEE